MTWVYLQPLTPYLAAGGPVEAAEIEIHVRKLQACLQREHSRDDPTLLFALGKSLLRLGRVSSALEVLYGALDHAPANTSVHLELGRALLAFRRTYDALAVLWRGVRIAESGGERDALSDLLKLIEAVPGAFERRVGAAAQRVPLNVTITRSDGIAPGVYTALNISETGICVNSSRRESLDSFVALAFVLEGEEIHTYAKLIWCRDDLEGPPGRRCTIGLQFLTPARSVVERIRRYVSEQIRGGPSPCPSPSRGE